MFCSAMPTLTSRIGNICLNWFSLLEPTESLTTATMRVILRGQLAQRIRSKASRQS